MRRRAASATVALVTGAGVRVGRAIALALADAGSDVAVHYRGSTAEAREVVRRIRALGRRSEAFRADLADPAACRALPARAEEALGGIDFLVHSAANFHRAPFESTDVAVWQSALDVNARAAFLLAQAAAPSLRARRGRIVLISDLLAVRPVRRYLAHSVSKAAVEGLVRALAVELAPRGVRVVSVAPTFVATDLTAPFLADPEFRDDVMRRIPLGRLATVDQVAAAVVYAASPAAASTTGCSLRVDGGWTAQ
jgi:NAD(P)-dependent dehydrogenase (short-subunit alcohol dehydrogenase family)